MNTPSVDITIFRAINGFAGSERLLDAVGWFCARVLLVALFVLVGIRGLMYLLVGDDLGIGASLISAGARGAIAAGLAFLTSWVASRWMFRVRPYVALDGVTRLMGDPITEHSFPSSHAAAAFALGTAVFLVFDMFGVVLYVLALFVGLGRVFVGVHYPTDVLAGAVLGGAWGLVVHFIALATGTL